MENTILTNAILNGKWKAPINDLKGVCIAYYGGSRSFGLEQENSDFDICVVKTNEDQAGIGVRLNNFEDNINAHAIIHSLNDIFGDCNSKPKDFPYKQWFLSLMTEDNILWVQEKYITLKTTLLQILPQMRIYTTTNFLLAITEEELQHLQQNAKVQLSYKKTYLYWIASIFLLNNRYILTDAEKSLAQRIKVSHNAFLIDSMKLTDEEVTSAKNTILAGVELAKTIDSPQSHLNNIYLEQIKPIADACFAQDTRSE